MIQDEYILLWSLTNFYRSYAPYSMSWTGCVPPKLVCWNTNTQCHSLVAQMGIYLQLWRPTLSLIPGSGRSPGGRDGNPLQCSCLENPRDGGAWWAAVYGVTQSQTQLKWLSSSSNNGNSDFIFLGSKIIANGKCNHEIKRCLLLGRKVMTNTVY